MIIKHIRETNEYSCDGKKVERTYDIQSGEIEWLVEGVKIDADSERSDDGGVSVSERKKIVKLVQKTLGVY